MKRFGALLFAILAVGIVSAQDFAFKVMANSGANEYKLPGQDWQKLRTGTTLPSNSELRVGEASSKYVGLYHKSGQTMQLTDAGSYKVVELEKQVKGKSAGVISKYADFVQAKMTEQERENTKNRLAATGAVERGLGNIDIYLPGSANFFQKKSWICWENKGGDKTYILRIKNIWDATLMELEMNDNFYEIDFDNSKLKDQNLLVISVALKDDPKINTGDIGIRRESKEDIQKFEDEYKSLEGSLDQNSPLNKLIMAEFFEDKNIMVDASSEYLEAIRLNPDVEYFKEAYAQFLMRNGYVTKPIDDPLSKK